MPKVKRDKKDKITFEIVSSPSEDELRPDVRAKQEIAKLLSWESRSRKVDWVVGQPVQPAK